MRKVIMTGVIKKGKKVKESRDESKLQEVRNMR